MDDIHLEDPRKFSAKQIKAASEQARKQRSIWQYFFDLFIKTLLLATLISINFTLFANAGSYNLFSSSMRINVEAEYIYLAIFTVSFLLMFIVSFFRKLENFILALCFALICVASINQFATFEKHSGLLVIFNGVFSDNVNIILYEYSLWIIGLVVFIVFWLFINLLRRQFMLYFMLGLMAVLGWILSEAYLNTSSQYFKTVAAAPTLRSEGLSKNLVFLSFNSLTSPNNLMNMYQGSKQHINIKESFNNALGFYTRNQFILYPNAMVKNSYEPFLNLIAAYNPDSEKEASAHVLTSAVRNDYFNFTALQSDRLYLKESSLYDMLRKDGYSINVYQTRDIDTCYLNNKLAAASCKEKVNAPIALNSGQFSVVEKSLLLTAQWLNSTGFVSSLNPLLKLSSYVSSSPALSPMGFDIDNLYAMNSFKVFDQIIENIDHQTGNQAYFAIIDLPSETYIYDEYCQLKDMPKWLSEENVAFAKNSTDDKRSAYADQVNCLYGNLEKFIQQLDKSGQLENTTIVVEGLNNPLGLNKIEKDYYRQLQVKDQVMLAIRPANASKSKIDYSVCRVSEILNSYFFSHKPCKEFSDIKTTDKNMAHIKNLINQDKYKKHILATAQKSFDEWYSAWAAHNKFESNFKYQNISNQDNEEAAETEIEDEIPAKAIEKIQTSEAMVEDVPEQALESIRVVSEEKAVVAKTPELPNEPIEEAKPATEVLPEEPLAQQTKPIETAAQPQKARIDQPDAVSAAPVVAPEVDKAEEKPVETNEKSADIVPQNEDQLPATQEEGGLNDIIEVEDITEDEVKPASDIKVEENTGEDVIPDTLFDEGVETITENQVLDTPKEVKHAAEETISKVKQAIKAKEAQKAQQAKKAGKELEHLSKSIEKLAEDDELRDVLEAPVAQGQKLSPEELKKQYHKTLKEAAQKADSNVNIEVKVIEN